MPKSLIISLLGPFLAPGAPNTTIPQGPRPKIKKSIAYIHIKICNHSR